MINNANLLQWTNECDPEKYIAIINKATLILSEQPENYENWCLEN